MSKTRRGLSFLLCLVMAFSLFAGVPFKVLDTEADAADTNTNPGNNSEWVTAWHTSMLYLNGDSSSNISTAVSALSSLRQRTFRTLIQIPMGGRTVKLTYSNEYSSGADLLIGEFTLANGRAGNVDKWADNAAVAKVVGKDQLNDIFADAINNGDAELKQDYYNNWCIAIKAGHQATTNAINISSLDLKAMDYVSVSTWVCNMTDFEDGITGGLIGGLTHYLGIAGLSSAINYAFNHTEEPDLSSIGLVSPIELANSDETGDYNMIPFLKEIDVKRDSINGVEKTGNAYTTVIFGDSTLANNIPTLLESRLLANDIQGVSVVWAAIKGNEFLLDGQSSVSDNDKNGPAMGESGLNRAYKDALDLPGVKKVIVKLGINDILHPNCDNMDGDYAHTTTASEIIAAYKQFIDMAHKKGIEVYFYELTPWQGYTRNGNVKFTQSIDAVRTEVNAWLAKYGKAYDDFHTIGEDTNTDDYTGTVNFNANYGSSSHTQNCDKVYQNSPTSVNGPKSYSHKQPFDTFGYISLDALNGADSSIMDSKYTTDGIHFTSIGQNKVSNATPLSIFKIDKEVPQEGQEVVVPDIYVASTKGQLQDGKYYYICNTEGSATSHNGSQENKGVLATAPDYETTGAEGEKMDYHRTGGSNYFDAKLDLKSTDVTVQRGAATAPYIVGTGVEDSTQWQTLYKNKTWYWLNSGTDRYLAWYYPGAKYGFADQIYQFSTGTVETDPDNESSFFGKNAGWYTFTTVSSAGDNYPFSVYLYYKDVAAQKTLVYRDRKVENESKGYNVWAATHKDHVTPTPVTLYVNTNGEVHAKMDLTAPANWGTEVEKDTYVVDHYKGTDSVYYLLKDDMPGADGNTQSHENKGSDFGNSPDGNGKFNGYTYGTEQAMYWKSSDTTVATVNEKGAVTVTGEPGISTITANYFWKEFNDLYKNNKYKWDDNNGQYYSEDYKDQHIQSDKPVKVDGLKNGYNWVEIDNGKWVYTNYNYLTSSVKIKNVTDYSTDIIIDNQLVDNYNKENVVNGMTSLLEALYITAPADIDYLPGHWEWSSSDKTVADISSKDGAYATLKYTGKTGSTTITVKYVDDKGKNVEYNGKTIESSIIVNTTEKPLTIDIKVNDTLSDYYTNNDASKTDEINLEAFVQAPYEDHNSGTYSWQVIDANGNASRDVITLDTTAGKSTKANIVGEGHVIAVVTYSYKDSLGNSKTATSAIYLAISFGVRSNTVIFDFGLPVNIDLTKYINSAYSASGISAAEPSVELLLDKTTTDEFSAAKSAKLKYGEASLNESNLTYTPGEIAQGVDTVYYSAAVDNGFKYASVNIIPASSIYYEDSFVTYNGTGWKVEGEAKTGVYQDIKDDVYGYDAAYGQYTTYSNGSAHYVTVDNTYGANLPTYKGEYPTASLTFTGTGFAVYSTSDSEAGYVSVKYKNETTGATKKFMVNSFANGDYDQTPTVQVLDLPYGTYTVTLTVVFDKSFDGNNDGHYTYCLDAVRIYEPLKGNVDANNAYAEVGEANAQYKTVRSMLLDANSFGKISAAENGAVFLDSKTRLAYDENHNVTNVDIYGTSVSDYTNYGPKNEVYLGQGQGIAFKIENAAQLADIQLGIKQAGRDSGEVIINGHTIKVTSATDMYYSIKQYMTEDATVVVVNPGSSVISLTVLKTTKNDAQLQTAIIVTPELGKLAAERMMSYVNTPTEPMPIEPTVEPTVEPTEEPQPSKDPTPSEDPEPSVEPTEEPQPSEDPQPDDDDQDQDNALMNILKKIGDFFKKLFGGWKK